MFVIQAGEALFDVIVPVIIEDDTIQNYPYNDRITNDVYPHLIPRENVVLVYYLLYCAWGGCQSTNIAFDAFLRYNRN